MMNGFGWGGWVLGTLTMVGFWALIFWAVVSLTRGPRTLRSERTAEQILDDRLARGDIDAEEHSRRREALRAG